VGKAEGKKQLARPRQRLKGNIEMDLQEIWWEQGACTGLIWLRIGRGGGYL
jgi:hypothetical protein